ncbi:MAG TPA: VTT domain-containing protein [Acetobacteraceae bacterium]|nr:VTT domain-containing protein [Acetobacteraceae bacterium]
MSGKTLQARLTTLARRFWPPLLLLTALIAAWLGGVGQWLGWGTLARHQMALEAWVQAHPLLGPSLYALIYIGVVALSLPEAAVVTVAGGLLFGTLLGGTLAIIGSSIGAVVLFLAIRHHLARAVAAHGGRLVERLRAELEHNGFSYLLAVRLVPVFPFWLVNIAAALSGMRLLPFAAATVLGIIPATFVYASIGAGVGRVLATGGVPDLSLLFTPGILGPLIGAAALALLPVAWRRWKRRDA